MAINPITVERLKTFVLLGHSNADGWATLPNMVSAAPHLKPLSQTNPLREYWVNVYAATWAQPMPGVNATPNYVGTSAVDWLEMTTANKLQPEDLHPHSSPYDYPNVSGASYPRFYYEAWGDLGNIAFGSSYTPTSGRWFSEQSTSYGPRCGLEIPLSYGWKNYWGQQVGFCKVAFSSSFFLPSEQAATSDGWVDPLFTSTGLRPSNYSPATSPWDVPTAMGYDYGYSTNWTPADAFDFSVATDRFYKYWFNKMTGAAAALPAGTKMDVQLVIPWMLDNDSVARLSDLLRQDTKKAVLKFVDQIRSDLVANDWTTLPKHQIPIIWPKVHFGYPSLISPSENTQIIINDILAEIAKDDDFFEVQDSWSWDTLTDDGESIYGALINGLNHFGSSGYVQAAEDIMDTWENMRVESFDALDQDETITLDEARDRVRTYYSKSRSNTDLDDTTVNQHLNAAMYSVLNHVGDNAYWLRRRLSLEIDGGPSTVFTLPKIVHRLLVIHDAADPTYPIQFEQVGFGDGGRLQIHMDERSSGTYDCSFITMPKELTRDDQIVPAPKVITEWIIVEACRRLAAASSNAPLMGHFAGEVARLQSDTMRHMGQTQRSKNDRMRTQRRRPQFGYGRRTGRQPWGSDY